MSFTVEDFDRWFAKEHFAQLTPTEQAEALALLSPQQCREVLESLPPEVFQSLSPDKRLEVLKSLPSEEIRQYLDQLTAGHPAKPRKPRQKK